jgi:integrase
VLAASSVDGLANDLIPFGIFLADHHPQVTTLAQLDRGHIEGFLAVNRTRRWRGRVARDQQVSASVAHAAVLALRSFLDDITLWGWADRPARQLLFAVDVPRLPRPLPRALPPDDDTALLAAIGDLDDPFARCGLLVLRHAGLRLGELLDLELDAVVDYGPAGTWLRVPLGKLKTERSVPLDDVTVAALDGWAPPAASNVRSRTRRPAGRRTFCSPPRDVGSARGGSAPGWTAPPRTPGCSPTPAPRRGSPRTGCATPTPPAWPTPGCRCKRSWRYSGTSPQR